MHRKDNNCCGEYPPLSLVAVCSIQTQNICGTIVKAVRLFVKVHYDIGIVIDAAPTQ